MKWFYAGCGALVLGILLVAPAHAGPGPSKQRPGQRSTKLSGQRARHHPVRHRKPVRPGLPWQYPWEWLQPVPEVVDPAVPVVDPATGVVVPGGGDDQPEVDAGAVTMAGPTVTPKGGNPRQQPRFANGSAPMSGPPSGGR
jgi:hypothetical protein